MSVPAGFRVLDCPNCGCEFGIVAYLVLRTEFPCPNCDAVLRVSNRKETAHQEKAVGIPFLISAISLIILLFVTMGVILNPYPSPQVVISLIMAYSFILLMLVSLGRAMSATEKSMRLEVVRLRQSCESCGYITPIAGSSFCPKCGASFHAGSQSRLSSNDQALAPVRLCMICGNDLSPFDTVMECPDCGSAFHPAHLVEYLHVHSGCPVCGRHIDEMELAEKRTQEGTELPARATGVEGTVE